MTQVGRTEEAGAVTRGGFGEEPAGVNVFRLEGDYWTVVFDGTVVRLRDARGMRQLALLLQHPGIWVDAVTLVADGSEIPSDLTSAARERARVNVTRTLRGALARVASAAPALSAHLEATIRTGKQCIYLPDPRACLVWVVANGGASTTAGV